MSNIYEMRINELIKNHDYLLKNNNNVVGIGLGNKIINGNFTEIPTLTFFVKKKVSSNLIRKKDLIPKFVYGALTDVIEGGEIKLCDSKVRPVYGGVSISNKNVEVGTENYGTIAYPVVDRETKDKIYILSYTHVLTGNFTSSVQSSIVQPAVEFDKNIADNYIAKITKVIPLDGMSVNDKDMNEGEAGIAIVGRKSSSSISNFIKPMLSNKKIIKETTVVEKGNKVSKIGANTGKTDGKIIATNFKTQMSFGKERYYFKNQIVADCIVDQGDSGALGTIETGILIKNTKAFGMLMGGLGEFSIFNPIDRILELLDVELWVNDKM